MARFESYAPILKRLEGGFVDHPDDRGGPTNMGVTLATFRAYYGKEKTADDLRRMTDTQWTRIMKVYWDSCKGDRIDNQSIANLVVDWEVNSGIKGRKGVQRCLGLTVDGVFGSKTLAALNSQPAKCVFCKVMDARMRYYTDLVAAAPSQAVFLKGWMNRLKNFEFQ